MCLYGNSSVVYLLRLPEASASVVQIRSFGQVELGAIVKQTRRPSDPTEGREVARSFGRSVGAEKESASLGAERISL